MMEDMLETYNEYVRVLELLMSKGDIKNHKLFFPSLSNMKTYFQDRLEETERNMVADGPAS